MMKRATSTRRTKRGATIQERKRKDGTIQRKRTNADGSIRNSRRTTSGAVKSATRKTAAGGAVKSMMRGGTTYGKNSNRVAKRNSPAGRTAAGQRRAARIHTRRSARQASRRR